MQSNLAIQSLFKNSRRGAEAQRSEGFFFTFAPLRLCVGILFLLAGCGQTAPASPTADTPSPGRKGAQPAGVWPRKAGSDWWIFLGPNQDSRSPETGIFTKWGDTGLKLVWQVKLGTSYGPPTIADGRLMQLDRFGDKSRLYCLNAETGKELWRFEFPTDYEDLYQYNNGPRCSPVIDGDRVYAYGVDGVIVCCRTEDGKLLWQKNLSREFGVVQNFFGVGSTPVIEGDLLIAMVGGSPPESQRVAPGQLDRVVPNGTGIVALNRLTGEVKYK